METIAGDSSDQVLSTHVVLSNDDLLTDILLRLPVVSLHVFKYVSKRWFTIITNPNFTLRHSPSGLFLPRQFLFEYDFVQLNTRIPANRSPSPTTITITLESDSGKVEILQSCNGLLLCRSKPHKLYVYNPSIHRFKPIPKCQFVGSVRMAFDGSKSPFYKIIYAGIISDHYGYSIRIQIYSSEACDLCVWGDRFPLRCFRGFKHGIYWNNAIHWVDTCNSVLHFKLDVLNRPLLTRVQTPPAREADDCDRKLLESRGCLLLLCIDSRNMSVYEMSEGEGERESGWSVKYVINLDEFMMMFPKQWRTGPRWFCSVHVRCVVIGKEEEDSFLVMEMYGKIVKYKIVTKTLYKICELESVHSPVSFQFIASVAGV